MRCFSGCFVSVATVLVFSVSANAQPIEFEVKGGVLVPTADLSEMEDAGFSAGVFAGYAFSDRLSLGISGGLSFLRGDGRIVFNSDGNDGRWPDLTVWRYSGEFRARPLPGRTRAWDVLLNFNVGAATLSFDDDRFGSETYPSVGGGFSGELEVSPTALLFAIAQADVVFSDSSDFGPSGVPVTVPFEETVFLGFAVGARFGL